MTYLEMRHYTNKKKAFKANTEVLMRLARAFYENRSLKKTYLHFVSRTSWSSFIKYLEWLKSKNYVERKTDGKDQLYQLTDSGKEMFDMVLKLHEHTIKTK